MKQLVLYLVLTVCTLSCVSWYEEDVIITTDFVINPHWNSVDNSFAVYEMKARDGRSDINPANANEAMVHNGLVMDTSSSFIANIEYNGERYSTRKIYFNKDNGVVWRRIPGRGSSMTFEQRILGELKRETWYLLGGLSELRTVYYIYKDHSDSLHVIKSSRMTNI